MIPSNDIRVISVIRRYRATGYAVWAFLQEQILQAGADGLRIDDAATGVLADFLAVKPERFDDILYYCVMVGLIGQDYGDYFYIPDSPHGAPDAAPATPCAEQPHAAEGGGGGALPGPRGGDCYRLGETPRGESPDRGDGERGESPARGDGEGEDAERGNGERGDCENSGVEDALCPPIRGEDFLPEWNGETYDRCAEDPARAYAAYEPEGPDGADARPLRGPIAYKEEWYLDGNVARKRFRPVYAEPEEPPQMTIKEICQREIARLQAEEREKQAREKREGESGGGEEAHALPSEAERIAEDNALSGIL